ncbi:hypothetical protein [Allostreptomyces psammosilenae]|uniref:SCP2 domain-containing protein n=1 Tax=Allostreptomyces psammosilenae TaxID=1892865 RepID=A0A852ZX25_9ACTN|nr:hypothetical protein [Allostreptomyces psammosilenae]NYI05284.1 hypothetical protein [Allostreptomyces psammosilenae]
MSPYTSRDQAVSAFQQLFETLQTYDSLSERLLERGLTLHFAHTDPEIDIFVGPGQVLVDEVPEPASIALHLSTEDAHHFWRGRLPLVVALDTGRLVVRGHLPSVFQVFQILAPAFLRYPLISARAAVA